jgi:hypothetical protein
MHFVEIFINAQHKNRLIYQLRDKIAAINYRSLPYTYVMSFLFLMVFQKTLELFFAIANDARVTINKA